MFIVADSPHMSIAKDSDFLGSAWGHTSLMSRPFTSPSVDDGGFDRSQATTRPVTSVSQRSRLVLASFITLLTAKFAVKTFKLGCSGKFIYTNQSL